MNKKQKNQKELEDRGLNYKMVSNGQEAVDIATKESFDIIFMDIQMPVLGGIEATEKILDFEEKTENIMFRLLH